MLSPRIRFHLYVAFTYFSEDKDFEYENEDGKSQTLRPATVAKWANINLTTIYRWERALLTDWRTLEKPKPQETVKQKQLRVKEMRRVKKMQANVRRMKEKIDKYLEDHSQTREEFFKELRIVCAITHICNKASIRGLWELVEKKKVEKIQNAIRDAAAIVSVKPETIQAALQQRIEAMTNNAMD